MHYDKKNLLLDDQLYQFLEIYLVAHNSLWNLCTHTSLGNV